MEINDIPSYEKSFPNNYLGLCSEVSNTQGKKHLGSEQKAKNDLLNWHSVCHMARLAALQSH